MAIYRATLVSFDAGTYTASLRIDGSSTQRLDSIKVSRGLPAAEMTASRRLLVDTGDHGDPADAIVFAVVG